MKKILLSFAFIASAFIMNAQMFCDFETPSDITAIHLLPSGTTATASQPVANPAPDAVNSSDNCLKANSNSTTSDGNKIDAFIIELAATDLTLDGKNYIKFKVYVTGGAPALLKPRGGFGTWSDSDGKVLPVAWIGVAWDTPDTQGVPQGTTGWYEMYFDVSAKTAAGNALQIQFDWQKPRDYDLEMYFDDFEFVTDIPTAIESAKDVDMTIFSTDRIAYLRGDVTISEVTIYDITGRVVKKVDGNDIKQVGIDDLRAGMYIVSAIGNNKAFSQKIMKQ